MTRFIASRAVRHGHAEASRDQPSAHAWKLLEEARALCQDARSVRLSDADMDALRARFGESASDMKVALALRGIMRRRVHDWLRRAEKTVAERTTAGPLHATPADEQAREMLRRLVDAANVAVMTGSRDLEAWAKFGAATEGRAASDPFKA